MTSVRKIIQIDEELCTGCGECVPDCAEGSLVIVDGKARLVEDKLCDGLGACLKSCPVGALKIIEREADEFDQEAVDEYLANKEKEEDEDCGCGCASAQFKIHTLAPPAPATGRGEAQASALGHWPVQIRLVSPKAPFLENCDLLIAADCTAGAYADFHRDFLTGRVLTMGCPKFDDAQLYVDRFRDIFTERKLNSVTILIMEVPCCGSMLQIVKEAVRQSGTTVPIRQVVVSTQGKVLAEQAW